MQPNTPACRNSQLLCPIPCCLVHTSPAHLFLLLSIGRLAIAGITAAAQALLENALQLLFAGLLASLPSASSRARVRLGLERHILHHQRLLGVGRFGGGGGSSGGCGASTWLGSGCASCGRVCASAIVIITRSVVAGRIPRVCAIACSLTGGRGWRFQCRSHVPTGIRGVAPTHLGTYPHQSCLKGRCVESGCCWLLAGQLAAAGTAWATQATCAAGHARGRCMWQVWQACRCWATPLSQPLPDPMLLALSRGVRRELCTASKRLSGGDSEAAQVCLHAKGQAGHEGYKGASGAHT